MTLIKTLGLGLSLATIAACSTAAEQSKQPSPSDVVATVGSTSITLAQVDETALQQPTASFGNVKLSQAIYDARRAALDEAVGNVLLDQEAKSRGVDRTALLDREVTSKVQQPTDADVQTWFQENQGRLQGATFEQVRSPIRSLLVQQRTAEAREAFITQLRSKAAVRIMLEPPRQTIAEADSPAMGPKGAPIEMIEFSDFQCPFCFRVQPTLEKVLSTYGDKVRFVYRNYPLPSHPNARPAAEAAQCANEQGKFWPYHDRLFGDPRKLSDADLKQAAVDLGLDAAKFNACVDSHKYKARVDADMQAGDAAGVNGTPAFFINGRQISGAQPYEVFKQLIDEELALKKAQ